MFVLGKAGYDTRWTGWKVFDVLYQGDNFGAAWKAKVTDKLMYCTSGEVTSYHEKFAQMAQERGFTTERPIL